jgi:cytochrome c-type protein NapB
MKSRLLILASVVAVGAGCASMGGSVSDKDIGLSKTAVTDVPVPETFAYQGKMPGTGGDTLPLAYVGAPPQIPHDISPFVPVTTKNNACQGCHNRPEAIGQPKQKFVPTPLPKSHYESRYEPSTQGKSGTSIRGANYNCTTCHVPQADAKPLVGNTFTGGQFTGK